MGRSIACIAIIVLLGLASIFFILTLQDLWLVEFVMPTDGNQKAWIETFDQWSKITIISSLLSSLLWYFIFEWGIRVTNWRNADKRGVWEAIAIIPAITSLLSLILVPSVNEGATAIHLLLLVIGVPLYYLMTLFCSPAAYKYVPFGAKKIIRY